MAEFLPYDYYGQQQGGMPQQAAPPSFPGYTLPGNMGRPLAPSGPAAGGGVPPTGAAPATPGAGAVGAGGTTATPPQNPLESPHEAVARSLWAEGLNPATPTYGIIQLLKRADDIVRGLAGRLAMSGQADTLTGGGFQSALNALISGGGPVISGRSEGQQALNALNTLVKGVTSSGGQGSEGAQFLASILGPDPDSASAFAESLLYGGAAKNVRGALQRGLAFYPAAFRQAVETPEGYAAAKRNSALDMLLSGMIPGYSAFGGAPGTALPPAGSGGTPSQYTYQGPPPR